jgi:hypothetical protein
VLLFTLHPLLLTLLFDFGAANNPFEVADIVIKDSSDDEKRADVFCDSVCPLACME